MSIFETGEEIICVDPTLSDGQLRQGRTYSVLDQSPICECCINVGIHMWCSEQRFRRPRTDESNAITLQEYSQILRRTLNNA